MKTTVRNPQHITVHASATGHAPELHLHCKKQERKMRSGLVALLLAFLVFPAAGFAQSIAYVSFSGSDENQCSRQAPCKTITHALAAVPAGSVVDIIASGIYDTFTITKAVSVEADPGVVAQIRVPSGGTGITINAGSSDTVSLKRLSIWGSNDNEVAIQGNSAGKVMIEDCVSRNVRYGASLVSTGAAFKVTGGVFEGTDTSIIIRAGSNKVSIDGVKIQGNGSNAGVDVVGSDVTITRSLLAGDGTNGTNPGVWVKSGSAAELENDVISGYGPGVVANGTVYMSNNTITNNSTGVDVSGGTAYTRGNNTIAANTTNVSGSLTPFAGE
jgi:Protein of unknown function (DUF1565)